MAAITHWLYPAVVSSNPSSAAAGRVRGQHQRGERRYRPLAKNRAHVLVLSFLFPSMLKRSLENKN
jgi:hypothetical protein